MTTVLDVLRDLRWLSSGRQAFRGAAFVGGFSYADTLDSAKGSCLVFILSPKDAEE